MRHTLLWMRKRIRGRPALDTAGLTGYPHDPMNDPEVTMPPRFQGPVADAVPAAVSEADAGAAAVADLGYVASVSSGASIGSMSAGR